MARKTFRTDVSLDQWLAIVSVADAGGLHAAGRAIGRSLQTLQVGCPAGAATPRDAARHALEGVVQYHLDPVTKLQNRC